MEIPSRLGSFEIHGLLGKGGMGEVYRARDGKLGRDVALKFLPAEFAADRDRMVRFEREARVLASLNHPNIAQIYGLEQSGTTQFLVLELVEGETLADLLRRGPLPYKEALDIARQILEGIEAAHEKDVTHRDLKPANIKITPDGRVKILDFGLAKALTNERPGSISPDSPTVLGDTATQANTIMGTASYMSPEQAKGRAVDRRSDIFSFGCILYEMLAGRRAFDGENIADILSHVLQREPDWTRLPPGSLGSVRRLLELCLAKDLRRRRQTATDVRIDIEQVMAEPSAAAPAPNSPARPGRIAWIASLAAALVIIIFLALIAADHLREIPPAELRLQILPPGGSISTEFALAPDGAQIVFVASGDGPQRLWLRALNRTDAKPIVGTEGAEFPFWSADSRSLGFFAASKLYRIDLAGGSPQWVANAPSPRGACWSASGGIVFAPTNGSLMRVAATGGEPVAITQLDSGQTSHRYPYCLPDGRRFLFFAQGNPAVAGIYMASVDGGQPKRLVASGAAGAYLNPDQIVFLRQGALAAQRIDVGRQELIGEPVVIADPVSFGGGLNFPPFSVSANGQIAYRAKSPPLQLVWFDRTGKFLGAATQAGEATLPSLSPDGQRVAFDRSVQNNTDIWWMDLARSGFVRLTVNPTAEQFPVWSPDGMSIAFESNPTGPGDLFVKAISGTQAEKLLLATPNNKAPQDWSRDGRFLLYLEVDPKTSNDLWAFDLTDNKRSPRVIANSPFDEKMAQFSPDGLWVAYATNESGRFEIVVQPFPEAREKWQVSTGGGIAPRWRADGRELYFVAPDGKLMGAPITASNPKFEAGAPQALFVTRLVGDGSTSFVPQYAVSRDGRFLISQPVEESGSSAITMILNWSPPKK